MESLRALQEKYMDISIKESSTLIQSPDELANAAETYLQMDMPRPALFRLDQALRADPRNQKAHRLLRDHFRKLGQEDKARLHERFLQAP